MNNSNSNFSFSSDEYHESWGSLVNKWDLGGIESLTEDEKKWFVTFSLIGDIGNGGLFSFFYNSGADNLEYTLDALNYFEAYELIDRIEKISSLFGEVGVPRDITARNEVQRNWGEKHDDFIEEVTEQAEVQKMADELELKLQEFLISHPELLGK